jgi:phosphoglycolate phosphatase
LIQNGLEVAEAQAFELLNIFRLNYKSKPTPLDSIFPYVTEALLELITRGVKLCICTNKPRILAEKVLRELGLINNFEYINAGGDLPSQKPHPDNLLKCLFATGANAHDAILIGDSVVDQELAAACGVSFCWYSAGNDDGVDGSKVDLKFEHYSKLIQLLENASLIRAANHE